MIRTHPGNEAATKTQTAWWRQYLPKRTDLSGHTQAELDAIADELNDRPRETLGWLKLTEVLNKFLIEAGGALNA